MKPDIAIKASNLIFFLLISGISLSQPQVISQKGITDADLDDSGNLFLTTQQGSVIKYDSSYRKILSYSPVNVVAANSIDVSNSLRLFAFYKNDQSCLLFDRNLRLLNTIALNGWAGEAVAAAQGSDHGIWLVDDQDFSLKKIDPVLNTVEFSVKLPLIILGSLISIRQIEEYQNRIYINNVNDGIYVFDLFGNLLQKYEVSTPYFFKFYMDKLYFIDQNAIKSLDIYSRAFEMVHEITLHGNIITPLCRGQRVLLIFDDGVVRLR